MIVNVEFRGAVYPILYRPGDNASSILKQIAPGEGVDDRGITTPNATRGRKRFRIVTLRGPTQWWNTSGGSRDDPPALRIEEIT